MHSPCRSNQGGLIVQVYDTHNAQAHAITFHAASHRQPHPQAHSQPHTTCLHQQPQCQPHVLNSIYNEHRQLCLNTQESRPRWELLAKGKHNSQPNQHAINSTGLKLTASVCTARIRNTGHSTPTQPWYPGFVGQSYACPKQWKRHGAKTLPLCRLDANPWHLVFTDVQSTAQFRSKLNNLPEQAECPSVTHARPNPVTSHTCPCSPCPTHAGSSTAQGTTKAT